ncbi:uncharacterized protein JCM6883_005908 [Sporobolomyces salmoneus]|uniref:uncharacterized protein n=1 Tax=Sporobolomyces salmoneus TaxID=183962 RepID=UPI0031787611
MSSLNNTSVNIATAFRTATIGGTGAGGGGLIKGGRREDFPPLDQRTGREREVAREEEAEDEEQGERRRDESSKAAAVEGSASKKRKKTIVKDPAFRHRPGETESSEEYSTEEHETVTNGKKGKKRAKVRPEEDQNATNERSPPRRPRRSTKPVDPSYKPSQDPSFHPNNTSSSDEDSPEDSRRRRSRSKSKGTVGGVDAIPRGIRDGEVWYGKGKKKRTSRGGGKSGTRRRTSDESVESREGSQVRGEGEEEEDLGGMSYHDNDFGTPDPEQSQSQSRAREQEEEEEDDQTPPAPTHQPPGGLVSFFLRRKSPSPPSSQPTPPEAGPSRGIPSQRRSPLSLPSLSPFKQPRNRPSTVEPSPDPAFAAFDRSLHPDPDASTSRSIDELSHLRNSSYDYSEEERLVQAIEEERRRKPQPQAQPASSIPARLFQPPRPRQAPDTPVGMTPAPKSGAYPLTPGSPVNNLRRNGQRNRLPAPPSLLGQSNSNDAEAQENEGVWGRRCGNAVRPVVEWGERVKRKLQDPLLDWGKILKAFAGAFGVVAILLAIRYADSSNASLPFFPPSTSSSSPPTYSAPSSPPDNLDALVSRLSSLESAFSKLSTSSEADRSRTHQDHSLLDKLSTQLRSLERNFGAEHAGTREQIERLVKDRTKESQHVEGAIRGVEDDLKGLVQRVQELSDNQRNGFGRLDSLESGFSSTSQDLDSLSSRFDKLSQEVSDGLKSERVTRLALEAIEQKLPGKIGVRLDKSGRLEIDPTFWKHLKDAFVDKKEVEKTIEAKVKALDAKKSSAGGGGGLFGSRDKQQQPVVVNTPSVPLSWDDFLSSNEESLRSWIASDLEGRTGGDAFVSKKTFLDLLHREIKLLKRDFETKANENFEQMGQELLSKVAKQDEMRKKDAAYSARHSPSSSSSSSVHAGPLTIKSTDGQNVTAVITSLVDSALLRYSKDVLARPDYALFTSGGRVIRSLTSPTYEPHPLSRSRAALAWITGASAPRGRPAVTALHPDSTPGSCWPFEGQHGQLGIQLSRRVIPSDITIEHISRDVALDGDVSSAPKDFEVWAVVEGQENVVKLAQYRHEQLEAKRSLQTSTSLEDALNAEEPASLPPSPNHLLLSVGTYDPSSVSPIQTFPVTSAARQLSIPVQVVVVKILSNQGEPAYTCLYRVRVSGTTETRTD